MKPGSKKPNLDATLLALLKPLTLLSQVVHLILHKPMLSLEASLLQVLDVRLVALDVVLIPSTWRSHSPDFKMEAVQDGQVQPLAEGSSERPKQGLQCLPYACICTIR